MLRSLDDYRGVVDDGVLCEIFQKASTLSNKHILNINSTYQGGGVAEILHNLVVLINDAGIDMGWRILPGTPGFFSTTKRIHNALQGGEADEKMIHKEYYVENNEKFSKFTHIDHDCVVVHDPQPLPFIKFCEKRQPWVWRCHIDLSNPNSVIWDYLKTYIFRYDIMIVSDEKYMRKDLPIKQKIIRPSIDPLSAKNIDLSEDVIRDHLLQYDIPTDKPLVTQISRFDPWKDPEGVIEVFERVKEEMDCRLILCGSAAADDPEGLEIYRHVVEKYHEMIEKRELILINAEDSIMVNALQRVSAVVMQKSTKEGFGLTVTEALWKEKPMVASNVGGIPNQIHDGKTGFLVDPHDYDKCAERVVKLLKDPKLSADMGKKAKEFVRKNFLLTRHVIDYLDLFMELVR